MSIAKVGKFLVKNRAAIAFGVGTVTGVAALVETVRKSRKTVDILDEHKSSIESVRKAYHVDERPKKDMTKEERKRYDGDRFKVYWNTTKKLGKNYALAGGLALTSFFSYRYSYKTTIKLLADTEKKLAVTTAALSATQAKFNSYREEVRNRCGEQVDFDIMNDIDEGWTEVGTGKNKVKFKTSGGDISFSFNVLDGNAFDRFNHCTNVANIQAAIGHVQSKLDNGAEDGVLIIDILKQLTRIDRSTYNIPAEWEIMGYEKGDNIEYTLDYDFDLAMISEQCARDYYGNRVEAPEILVKFKNAQPMLKKLYPGDKARGVMEDAYLEFERRRIIEAENSISPTEEGEE